MKELDEAYHVATDEILEFEGVESVCLTDEGFVKLSLYRHYYLDVDAGTNDSGYWSYEFSTWDDCVKTLDLIDMKYFNGFGY